MQKASNLCEIHKDIHTLLGPREAMLHNVGKTPQPFHDQKDKFLDALASLAPTPPLLHTLFTLLVSLDSQRAIVEHEILTPRMCDSRSCFVMIYIDLW